MSSRARLMPVGSGKQPGHSIQSAGRGRNARERRETGVWVAHGAAAAAARAREHLVLGRYRPLRPLGSGGSGSVWLARDEASGLDVALKIVAREGKAGARAEREAVAAARLRHERCLRCYGVGHDDGHVYIAYEYVPGRTLREAMREGRLDDARAVEAAAQILDGLAHAHARGIVHRDVKPANVLLARRARVSRSASSTSASPSSTQRHADGGGRRARDARLHLAGAARAARPRPPQRRLGRRRAALGGARRRRTRSGTPRALESARAIERGAPPLATMRPDLPKHAASRRSTARSPLDPRRRPTAEALARRCAGPQHRAAAAPARRTPSRAASPSGSRRRAAPDDAVAAAGAHRPGSGRWRGGAALLPDRRGARARRRDRPARAPPAPRRARASRSRSRCSRSGTTRSASPSSTPSSPPAWLLLFLREPRWALLAGPRARCSRRSARSACCRSRSGRSARPSAARLAAAAGVALAAARRRVDARGAAARRRDDGPSASASPGARTPAPSPARSSTRRARPRSSSPPRPCSRPPPPRSRTRAGRWHVDVPRRRPPRRAAAGRSRPAPRCRSSPPRGSRGRVCLATRRAT